MAQDRIGHDEKGCGGDMLQLLPGSSAKWPWVGVDMRRARGGIKFRGKQGQQRGGWCEGVRWFKVEGCKQMHTLDRRRAAD